jgi:hypothetical protein
MPHAVQVVNGFPVPQLLPSTPRVTPAEAAIGAQGPESGDSASPPDAAMVAAAQQQQQQQQQSEQQQKSDQQQQPAIASGSTTATASADVGGSSTSTAFGVTAEVVSSGATASPPDVPIESGQPPLVLPAEGGQIGSASSGTAV